VSERERTREVKNCIYVQLIVFHIAQGVRVSTSATKNCDLCN